MVSMKRLSVIVALLFASVLTPISAHAVSPSPTPLASQSQAPLASQSQAPLTSQSAAPLTSQSAAHRAEKAAARATYKAALQAAANGRDLAFADAKATLLQSLQTAGKDHTAKQAANGIYKAAAMQIITGYKLAVETSTESFKAAIAALSGK